MPSREFAMIVQETSYGVPVASPTLGTNAFYLRLSDDNSFTMQDVPLVGVVNYGGGLATPACPYSDQNTCEGQLSGVLYAGTDGVFAKFMMDWAMTQINSGRTTPWTTTDAAGVMPPTDLASVSIYHGIQRSDGTYDRRRYGGVKVHSGTLNQSRQDPLLKYSFQLMGIRDDLNAALAVAYPNATEFPAPAETDYLCNPYLFSHTGGLLKVGSIRSQYDSASISWTNAMAPKIFETRHMVLDKFCGRNSKLSCNFYMKPSPDDLATLKALGENDTEISWDNGSWVLKIDFNAKNLFAQLQRQLPNNSTYSWNATIQNYFDPATASDLIVTLEATPE